MSARGTSKKQLPPANGKLVREPATCDVCGSSCKVSGGFVDAYGYYIYNDQKLCKLCIKKKGVL